MAACLQFVEHVEFPPGEVAAGVDRGEEPVEAADLVRREQEHALVLQGAARADRTSRAGARAVGEQQRGQDPRGELLRLGGRDAQDADRELGDRVAVRVDHGARAGESW